MRWAVHAARLRGSKQILIGNLEARKPFGSLRVDRRITLKWILNKYKAL
jgi:hypothetical protein